MAPSFAQRALLAYLQAITSSPIQTRLKMTGCLTVSANMITQLLIERTPLHEVSFTRLRKVLLSSLLLSLLRHYQFTFINRVVPPSKSGLPSVLLALSIDQLVFAPLSNALFFLLMALQSDLHAPVMQELTQKLWPSLQMYWRVWPAAKLFSYAFVPVPLRPLFGDLVGFFWAIFLSTMTQASKKKQEKNE